MMWNGATPPDLPPLRFGEKVLGVLRLAAMAVATLVLFTLYLLCAGAARLVPGLRLHHGVQRTWARTGLACTGLALRVEGTRMAHGGALVANHASWLDIFSMLAPGRVIYVAKAEVRSWPGIGLLAAWTGTMFVERKSTEAGRQQVEMAARIAGGQLLCFFPEATSTDGLRVLPFKSSLFGAFEAEGLRETVWVQPVTVAYVPRQGLPPEFYGWWGEMPFGKNVWNVVTRSRGGQVTVIFHPPLRVAEHSDRKALARLCSAAVRDGLARVVGAERLAG